jgi:mannosylglycerate hydrolase
MDQLYFVVHTHWDREWYQPFQRMRSRLLTMTDHMLAMLEDGALPCFHFDGQTIVLEDYLEIRPENARRISKLVKAGKLQIGPWYLLADSFIPSGEALIRNLEIGAKLARRFGKSAEIGYLPDQFGQSAQVPQILAGFGLKAAVVFRGVRTEIRRNRFVWEGLDGTGIAAIFLPFGYSNGASLPADSVEALVTRTNEIAERERQFAAGAPILVMNGNDHAEPDRVVFARLKEARARGLLKFEIGTLDNYAKLLAKLLAELPPDGTPRYRGELRSPARSNLTPGVTSARAWIKQRDFENSYLLEKLADPIAALAGRSPGGADPNLTAMLDEAWRIAIQNHPHDSICGCSIDQVHQDMRYRFDQAAMIGAIALRRATSAILASRGGAAAMAVFNPTLARVALVTGEAEIADPDAHYVVVGSGDRRIAAAIAVSRRARPFDIELKAGDFRGLMTGTQVMGQHVNGFELRRVDPNRFELDLLMARSPSEDFDAPGFRREILAVPDAAALKIHATSAARARVAFVDDAIAQAGFSLYRLERDEPASVAPSAASDSQSVENEYYRLEASARGLTIQDLKSGRSLELYLEDDGDRGDEYNFDPVADSPPIAAPESIAARVLERGAVRSRLGLSLVYRLPAALASNRQSRAAETVEVRVELVATIYAGLDRIDFEATVDNRARDHRLRAALSTPVAANESVSDTNFGVVRRPLDPTEPAGVTEDVYAQAPHRTFTAVESPELSVALMSRGIYETEVRRDARGATILLTLLRCVGWLSRGDLKMRRGDAGPEMETPDAQEIRSHRFEFALTTAHGADARTELVERSQSYAFPPRMFAARAGLDLADLQLCACDNPRIVFSTARAGRRAGSYIVRVFSASEAPETARLSFGTDRRVRAVDLAGRPSKDTKLRRRRAGAIEVNLRPFQIATFEVRPR